MTILEGSSFSVAPPTPEMEKRGGKIYICFLKFHVRRKQFCSIEAATLLHFNVPKHNRTTKRNKSSLFHLCDSLQAQMENGFKQEQGHRPLLRPGSSSLSWPEWFYGRVVCTSARTLVQFSRQHLVPACKETKQPPTPPPHQKPDVPYSIHQQPYKSSMTSLQGIFTSEFMPKVSRVQVNCTNC